MSLDQTLFIAFVVAIALIGGLCQIKDWWDGDGGGFA